MYQGIIRLQQFTLIAENTAEENSPVESKYHHSGDSFALVSPLKANQGGINGAEVFSKYQSDST